MDKVEYRRPSLARLYKEDKSYKDNFSRSYNSENIEKILSRTRSLINDFDSGKGSSTNSSSYSTLPPRFRLTGSKYSSSFISSPGGARSFKSRSPASSSSSSYSSYTSPSYSSLSSIRSPSLSRRSIPSLRSPSPSPADSVPSSPRILNDLCIPKKSSEKLPNGLPPDCGGRKRSEPPERSPSRRLETGRVENSKPVTNGDSPICNGLDNVAGTSVSTYSRRRSSGAHAPPTSGLSGSNSVKYERCYNELLSRINQIKMNGGETLHEGRTSSNVPEFDRTKKPTQDRVSHYERRENSVAGTNVGPGLTGLKNLGNTCYINSILQCLSNTTPLRQFFQSEFRRSFTCRSPGTGRPGTGCRLAEEFQVIFNMLWAGDTRYFSPNRFKDEVGKMKRTFRGYEQQDSHEFLTILMDSLHEDLKEPESKTVLSGACVESGEKSWGEFLTRNKSIVSDLFYGQLKSTVICLSCQETSSTFEVFSNVSLPLPSHDHCSLRDCLDLYLKDEEIQGWHCPRCKTKRDARKKLDITKLPPILVLHFKRFTSDGWCRKKQTSVEFPETNLNMVEYTAANSETRDFRYDLYAVSNHYGTMESGHYTAYCKNKYKWYKFDDSDVTEISASKVKSPAAYILFYMSSRMDY